MIDGAMSDVSDRDALNLVFAVTRAVTTATHTSAALNDCLREICIHTRWRLGEVWIPRAEDGHLVAAHIRSGGDVDPELSAFIHESEKLDFAVGVGLPGRVFLGRQREWIPDVERQRRDQYLRADEARRAGLHAALGVPVIAGDEVLAALVFYMDRVASEDPRRVELVTAAAAQIGFLLRQQYADRMIAKLENLALAVPVIDIWEDIALAPIVGTLDERRSRRLLDGTLEFLEHHRSRVLLLDLTGLAEIDSAVVKTLVDLSRGAEMLGTSAIFTGVSPQTARALIHLGIPLGDIRSASTLADGLRDAMALARRPIGERARVQAR
jgi:anti-anti-sigma regulatory factor